MIKKYLFLLIMLSYSLLNAQDKEAEMADVLRESGKIYNVVAVVMIVFIGLLVYLFFTERKLRNLEKKLENK